jgi:hypothetical protein
MKCVIAIAVSLCVSSVAVSAQQIIGENADNTGASVNGSGVDNHWSLVSYDDWYDLNGGGLTTYTGTYTYAYVATTYPGPTYWTPDTTPPPTTTPTAKWIAQNPNQGTGAVGTGAAPGIYTYQLTFMTTGTQTVQISGEVAADNQFGIVFNGAVEVSGPGGGTSTDPASSNYLFTKSNTTSQYGGQYGDDAPLTFDFDVTPSSTGTNTLDFLVNNLKVTSSAPYNNASGLFVTDFEVETVPEPPTWAIVLAGLGLAALLRFRAARALSPAWQRRKVSPPSPEAVANS